MERITSIEIELSDGSSDDELALEVFNKLAGRECFTEEDGWHSMVKRDVADEIGCSIADIEII